jgi:hypothetical protein
VLGRAPANGRNPKAHRRNAAVKAVVLCDNEVRLDIGTHETYFHAFSVSYRYAVGKA